MMQQQNEHSPDDSALDEDALDDFNHQSEHGSMAPGHARKIQDATVALYMRYIKTLRRKYLASMPGMHQEDVRPTDLSDYLISHATSFRPKTAINYRAGLLYWLNTLPSAPDTLHARLSLQVAFPKRGYKPSRPGKAAESLFSTKSSKRRTFQRRKFERLVNELNHRANPARRHAKRAQELLYWLRAALASGLRPIEWETARWEDREQGILRVLTAKKKEGNYALPNIAHLEPPKERLVRYVQVDEEDRIWVDQHMACVRRHLLQRNSFSRYYENNRIFLYTLSKEVFGADEPPFTLYMMRGQFSANRKRRGASPKEVGAMMGSSPRVSGTYYGKAQYGHHTRGPGEAPNADRQAPVPPQAGNPTGGRASGAGKFSFSTVGRKSG